MSGGWGIRGGHALLLIAFCAPSAAAADVDPPAVVGVPRFGVFETSFLHSGKANNPYASISATATFVRPDGARLTIPLFWDGGTVWRLRFSPNMEGVWNWSTTSANSGLNARSGSFTCTASSNRGGIRVKAGAAYHFEYQNGAPLWWFGDTQWLLYSDDAGENLNRATIFRYIDERAAQGFNVVHSGLLVSRGNNGGKQFTDIGAEVLNPAFFQEADIRLKYLNGKGITSGIFVAWGTEWVGLPSDAARLRFARYVVARYSAFNVYFVASHEWKDGLTAAQVRLIGNEIAVKDPHDRLVAVHDVLSVEEFAGDGWMSFGDYQQAYSGLHAGILAARDHAKPVVNAEYGYLLRDKSVPANGVIDKDNSFSSKDMRFATWDIAMAGGYFVTGFGTTYYGGYRNPGPFNVFDSRNDGFENSVRNVYKLFAGLGWLEWWKIGPQDNLISSSSARRAEVRIVNSDGTFFIPPRRTFWALAEVGRQYVAYLRGYDGLHTLSLGGAPAASYSVRRYDPRNGTYLDLGTYTGVGPVSFDPPDAQDWVYVLKVR